MILLDVMLPLKSGLEVLTEIRRNGSLTPVILLTAKGEEYDQVNGFRLGADDYIVKPFSPTLLISRIEAVLRRVGKGGDGVLTDGYISVNMLTHEVKCADKQVELTRREFDLLCFFMTNARLTLTRTQLLNSVWGVNFDGDERTVDTHIKQLRSKLGVDGCIKTVYRVGYKFDARTNPTDSNCF
ncbi:MAG TPA: DNA-binding response regulator [Ruminococcaceae bacterium]|nr:DNA-binding response regulator [Oscillospiraceae bacterium]